MTLLTYRKLIRKSVQTRQSESYEKFIKICSLSIVSKPCLGNTGSFFRKTSILSLGLSIVYNKSYKKQTLKSVIYSLWNLIASNNIIF